MFVSFPATATDAVGNCPLASQEKEGKFMSSVLQMIKSSNHNQSTKAAAMALIRTVATAEEYRKDIHSALPPACALLDAPPPLCDAVLAEKVSCVASVDLDPWHSHMDLAFPCSMRNPPSIHHSLHPCIIHSPLSLFPDGQHPN